MKGEIHKTHGDKCIQEDLQLLLLDALLLELEFSVILPPVVAPNDAGQVVPCLLLCGVEANAVLSIPLGLVLCQDALDNLHLAEQVKVHANSNSVADGGNFENIRTSFISCSLEGQTKAHHVIVEPVVI